ncbi:transcriptional regulator BetI [Aestuariivirga sp.]|uniref:transcriptional regulator BetI n=1 Tax=Aestuariivirga sp. TaxID=2650926 RepID=UPI00391A4A69
MAGTRTSIEQIRRRDLVEAAYLTFLDHGMKGMTMARIGERAGMSHGIVNYYFKTKAELLSAVVRKANFLILSDGARRLRAAKSPRERISAVIGANFTDDIFTREIARAWVSYYAMIGEHPEFERMQNALDRRVHSNLMHALRQMTAEAPAREIAQTIATMIDGLWIRHAKSNDQYNAAAAIRHIEEVVDARLAAVKPRR